MFNEKVPLLLKETHKLMSDEEYEPTKEEVESWMKMADLNKDKKVSLNEF